MCTYYLQQAMENFYFCSHLPIRAFNQEGLELLCTGSSFSTSTLPLKLHEWLKESQLILKSEPYVIFTLQEGIDFIFCPITPHHVEDGIYVIGPYTSCKQLLTETLPFKPAHCIPHLITLLYSLAKDHLEDFPAETTDPEDYSYHIIKAREYIQAHFKEPITLDALANHLNLNKSYLCTIFKKATKDSFCNYTNKIRIEESKKLLRQTNDSMIDIALAVGFSSASYFNTIFKKLEGKTPLEYRKNI